MDFIDKFDSNRAKALEQNQAIFDNHYDIYKNYDKLSYSSPSSVNGLSNIILKNQNELCCYCMRKIYRNPDITNLHRSNFTLEHIIPKSIKTEQYKPNGSLIVTEQKRYQQYDVLNETNYLNICFENNLLNATINISGKIVGEPYPHNLAYNNIVASCNGEFCIDSKYSPIGQPSYPKGATIDKKAEIDNEFNRSFKESKKRHCCNNARGEKYVEPFYLNKDVKDIIGYNEEGEIYLLSPYNRIYDLDIDLNENKVNLNYESLQRIRKFWYYLAQYRFNQLQINKPFYNENDVEDAILNQDLQDRIIQDLQKNDLNWLEGNNGNSKDWVWANVSEYSWYFQYYTERIEGRRKK